MHSRICFNISAFKINIALCCINFVGEVENRDVVYRIF